jgi:hypothetical protein
MAQLRGHSHPTRLRLDDGFHPCFAEPGDEIYANGIFEFNITRLQAFVRERADRFPVEWVAVSKIADYANSQLDEEAARVADLRCPILLAEIAPGQHCVIDGHHRLARARRKGISTLQVYRLRCPLHVPFLTSFFAYERYVEYWNDNVVAFQRLGPQTFESYQFHWSMCLCSTLYRWLGRGAVEGRRRSHWVAVGERHRAHGRVRRLRLHPMGPCGPV